jgi:uncharacterized protein YyaL (SSP411 family)
LDQKHVFTNRLIKEKSPYLLQHAHNPVDWYPWGEEAFQAALAQDKPIFLSIGYATCHWCHTMERESFEDTQIAELMNNAFINIKVDREELPEVDALYMDFAQSMMAGSAGWPLNLILTPQLEPFFAATYLPPHTNHGMIGLFELIQRIREVWAGEEREKVQNQAEKIVEVFAENAQITAKELPARDQVSKTAELLFKIADPIFGGIRGAPKFPVGYQYLFLLNYAQTMKDSRAAFLVERALDMMHRGGIYDHIGGGFSRYSVDDRWLIPHFEKMLYDNALLASAYTEAWRFTKKPLFKKVACEILDYVLRDMTHPEGGFYSAEDSDSEGVEGSFYTWDFDEFETVVGADRSALFSEFFGVAPQGNFEERNVLHTPQEESEFARHHNLSLTEFEDELREVQSQLFQERAKRVRPLKDDKILTSWNGLMIHAFAEAGAAFQIPHYLEAAKMGVNFIRTYLWDRENLFHRWRAGEALHHATLDDYAFLIRALITCFEKGEGTDYLIWAVQLADHTQGLFKAENGPFYQTDGRDASIILRRSQLADGAEPSGNAIHTENLLRLHQILHEERYLKDAEDVLKCVKKYFDLYSPGYFYHTINLNRYYDRSAPVLYIALNSHLEHKNILKNAINEKFMPHTSVVWIHPKDEKILDAYPDFKSYPSKEGKTTLYICRQASCQEPITDLQQMIEAIQKL